MDLMSLLGEALTLMITGMGFVFAFLGIMVYIIPLLKKLPADPIPEARPSVQPVSTPIPDGVSPDVIAAISAAISQYRRK